MEVDAADDIDVQLQDDQQQLREDDEGMEEEAGGKAEGSVQASAEFNPMKAIIMHNLECTHNIQRRRDIK